MTEHHLLIVRCDGGCGSSVSPDVPADCTERVWGATAACLPARGLGPEDLILSVGAFPFATAILPSRPLAAARVVRAPFADGGFR